MGAWSRRLCAVACGLLAALILVGAAFLAWPELLFTSPRAGAALKYFGAGWSPRWSSLHVTARALGSGRHRYSFRATEVCLKDGSGVFSGCFSELESSVVVSYSLRGPALERVERLVALSAGARLDLRRLGPARETGGVFADLRIVPVETLRVELSSFTLTTADIALAGDFRAELTPAHARPLSVKADLLITGPAGSRRLKAELTADADLLEGAAPASIDLVGRLDMGTRAEARTAFRLRRGASGFSLSGRADIAARGGGLRSLRFTDCEGSVPMAPGAGGPSGAELACRAKVVWAGSPAGSAGARTAIDGRAALSARRMGEGYEAELKAHIDPIAVLGALEADLLLRIRNGPERQRAKSAAGYELRAWAKVPRFEGLVASLRGTRRAVPAPLHVLRGPLSLAIESGGDPRADRLSARYAFSSALAHARERLILRAAGDWTVENTGTPQRALEHSGELILDEVALELPRLDIGRAPRLLLDKRITPGGSATAPPPGREALPGVEEGLLSLRSRLLVKTGKPLILFSNLAKDPIPAELDLSATYPPAAAAGRISVRMFKVELFRRSATLDHMNISFSSGSDVGALEGLLRYQTPSAEVRILLLGTTAKPRVELASVPAMKRKDILALLIFGKGPDELDIEQTASVRNTESALESRAFGLASLYLFGATPIEHVGYDSATKTASVKFRLPGGAKLEVGGDFERSGELRLRKQLAPHWAIQSELTSQGGQSGAAATFLEWFNRY